MERQINFDVVAKQLSETIGRVEVEKAVLIAQLEELRLEVEEMKKQLEGTKTP